MRKALSGVVGLALLAAPAGGQSDSTARPPVLTRREIVGTAIGTAAGIGVMQYDTRIRRWLRAPAQQDDERLNDRADAVAFVNEKSLFIAELALWGVGRLTRNETLADVSWHAAESVLLVTISTQVVRVASGRSRPFKSNGGDAFDYYPFRGWDDQAYRAVPSIHSAAAFATAAALTGETRRRRPGMAKVVAPVSFALAALPGLARMHADKHWASDVAIGAVWGTTIGMATVRWHHTRDDRLDRWMLGAGRAPNGDAAITIGRWR